MSGTPTTDLRGELLGAWRLHSYVSVGVDDVDDVLFPLGDHPRGFIMYTADGYMSAQLMDPDRRLFAANDPHAAPPGELASAAAGYLSYSGPFTVDGDVVSHHVEVSLLPNWVGGEQKRRATLHGDTLTLSPADPLLMGGRLRNATLVWIRA